MELLYYSETFRECGFGPENEEVSSEDDDTKSEDNIYILLVGELLQLLFSVR